MAYENKNFTINLNAPSTAYSTYQYRMVSAGTTAGTFIIGTTKAAGVLKRMMVLQDAPTVAGEACELLVDGITKIVVGSTKLSPGRNYICGALGIAKSSSAAVAQTVVYGPWLSAAQTTGSIGTALHCVIGITT
jgi:hypothetical protein